jgi:hypothetical protein
MIRPAVVSDMSDMINMLVRHHTEKDFSWPADKVRASMMLSHAMSSDGWLCATGDGCLLIASCGDSMFGAGKIAVEHLIRSEQPSMFGALLDYYETWARANGCTAVSLSCTDRFPAFTRLYGRRGYAPAEMTTVKALV